MSEKADMDRVGIIGAGITGLATAYLLTQKGFNVHLFEQEEEVGGLARSIPFLDTEIERYYHFIPNTPNTPSGRNGYLGIRIHGE